MPSFAPAQTRNVAILRIAEGGMGFIELIARQEGRFSRLFARKRLHPQLRADPGFRAMFLDEARLSGLIAHPNVTAVIEVGEDEDGPFLLMDYVDGATVAQLLKWVEPQDRPLPVALCVSIAAQTARGLHAAHQLVSPDGTPLGLVHRDISPNNLLLGYDGWLRVADFGIAKAKDNIDQTRVGVLKGNIGYMAPEYLRFQEVDHRSDLFALGVVLYELLTRERLYGGSDAAAIARRILEEPPPDIFEIRDLPPELCALSFDLLAKDRELRPPTALAVAARLDAIAANLATVDGPFDVSSFLEDELRGARDERRALVDAALSRSAAEQVAASAAAPPDLDASAAPSTPQGDDSVGFVSGSAKGRRPERAAWLGVTGLAVVIVLAFAVWRLQHRRSAVALDPGNAALWAGGAHNCALRDGQLVCWGSNIRGQLGDGTRDNKSGPVTVNIGPVQTVALGEYHTCALSADGRVSCWGRNARGEIGREVPTFTAQPLQVPGLGPATALASGRQHTCALLASARVSCWGTNDSGQLGRPASPRSEAAAEIPELAQVAQIFAGGANTCARLAGGELLCWGANASGQLGDGTRVSTATPTRVRGAEDFLGIAIGNNERAGSKNPDRTKTAGFMCAATRSGQVSCWGNNYTGQLGDGTREDRATPSAVLGITDAIQVAVGDVHACALHRSGAVSCWGRNEFGAVGDGTMGPSNVRMNAVPAVGITDAIGLALGGAHSCARRQSGMSCWGVNNLGQLGDGSTLLRSLPTDTNGFP